jgi:hypothetical protein
MARPKNVPAATPAATPLESGAGNMSEADRLAIAGMVPDEPLTHASTMGDVGMTASEIEARAREVASWQQPDDETSAALLNIGARMLTLEGRMAELEAGMEKWAIRMSAGLTAAPRVSQDAPVPIRPATPQEEAAYSRTNFALYQQGLTQHNGIQDWRDKGSPVLEPKEEAKQERRRS